VPDTRSFSDIPARPAAIFDLFEHSYPGEVFAIRRQPTADG
jgi:hypothetical protein